MSVADDDLDLPSPEQRRVERRLAEGGAFASLAGWLFEGLEVEPGAMEVLWRASGLTRAGVIAQLSWPRLDARVGIGIETRLAHAVVDRLLGFDRLPSEEHRQVTPVEWGILSFVFARALDRLDARPGPLGPWDLAIDRVGPDPFDARDLGPIATGRGAIRLGSVLASVRIWVPESLLMRLDDAERPAEPPAPWRVEAGAITLAKGLARLKVGGVLPIDGAALGGSPDAPRGPVWLTRRDPTGRAFHEGEIADGRITVRSEIRRDDGDDLDLSPIRDLGPLTLVIEIGAIPGDGLAPGRVIEQRVAAIDLTLAGRVVARGEFVAIDTELGVRVTQLVG